MAAAGVDERWCLGDLVGSEPVTPELVGAARQLDLSTVTEFPDAAVTEFPRPA
jgi:hypothetical protein